MANCDQTAARRGWEIYCVADAPPTLDHINAQLASEGLNSVSDRMYRHYRRLAFHGFEDYLPINELDVTLKLRRLGMAS